MRSPLRSAPPSQPSPYRYLGRGGGERPVRVRIILALVATLVLVAVPLYLWRRPQPESIASADAAQATPASPHLLFQEGGLANALGVPSSSPSAAPLPNAKGQLEIAPIKTLKCQNPGPGRTPPERCDGVRAFEDALTRAIRDSVACAPETRSGFVASFVLEMNFQKKKTQLFFGKSTTLAKSRRKELLACVERAMPPPDWDRIVHQHQKYTLNTVVTYPAIDAPEAASASEKPGADKPAAESAPRASGGGAKSADKPKKKKAPAKPAKKSSHKKT